MVVALDEFQTIAAFDSGNVEHALRSAVQSQREVGYVFAGSEPSLMEHMLTARRPFYKAGPVMRLDKIAPAEFAEFIEGRLRGSGMKFEPGLGEAIVELAATSLTMSSGWRTSCGTTPAPSRRPSIRLEDLHATLTRLLGQQHTMFEEAWLRLTLAQRAVLRALVIEDGRDILSADVRMRHRLAGTSSVQAALAALVRNEVVMKEAGRYVVTDSLFREWIARNTF